MGLRRELEGVKSEMRRMVEQNEVPQKQPRRELGVEVVTRDGQQTREPKPCEGRSGKEVTATDDNCKVHPQEKGREDEGRGAEEGKRAEGNRQGYARMPRKPAKQVMGVRKVWGLKKSDTCHEVAKAMVKVA